MTAVKHLESHFIGPLLKTLPQVYLPGPGDNKMQFKDCCCYCNLCNWLKCSKDTGKLKHHEDNNLIEMQFWNPFLKIRNFERITIKNSNFMQNGIRYKSAFSMNCSSIDWLSLSLPLTNIGCSSRKILKIDEAMNTAWQRPNCISCLWNVQPASDIQFTM